MIFLFRTGFFQISGRSLTKVIVDAVGEAALVSGIRYLKLQIIGFYQNASAILHCMSADQYPARKPEQGRQRDFHEIYSSVEAENLKPRVWSQLPAGRFNVCALKFRLQKLLRLASRILAMVERGKSPPPMISCRFTAAVAGSIVDDEEGIKAPPYREKRA